jgi:hypothetical protein
MLTIAITILVVNAITVAVTVAVTVTVAVILANEAVHNCHLFWHPHHCPSSMLFGRFSASILIPSLVGV